MSTVLLCYYGVWPAVVRTAEQIEREEAQARGEAQMDDED